jgi:hypothetical protein
MATHMHHRKLIMPKGDFTNQGRVKDIKDFDEWLGELDYRHKIVVFGNHGNHGFLSLINLI